jgi:hypothetical protein
MARHLNFFPRCQVLENLFHRLSLAIFQACDLFGQVDSLARRETTQFFDLFLNCDERASRGSQRESMIEKSTVINARAPYEYSYGALLIKKQRQGLRERFLSFARGTIMSSCPCAIWNSAD